MNIPWIILNCLVIFPVLLNSLTRYFQTQLLQLQLAAGSPHLLLGSWAGKIPTQKHFTLEVGVKCISGPCMCCNWG